MSELFQITEHALDAVPLQLLVAAPEYGAIVTFSGIARNNFAGRQTAKLEYEAYPEMALRVFEQLAAEAQERFAIGKVAIHHRLGMLNIGDTAVVIVVSSPHRQAAFQAASYLMDRIKEVAPIWKREHWQDGTQEWIGDETTRKAHMQRGI